MEVMIKISSAFILIVALFFVIFGTSQVFETINVVYDATQAAVLSQVTVNAPGTLPGFRESSGTARYFDDTEWQYSIDDTEVLAYLMENFELDEHGTRYNAGIQQFTIRDINTYSVNSEGATVTFWSTLQLDIPVHFGGIIVTDVSKELKVKAIYDSRY